MSAQNVDDLSQKILEVEALPSGSVFQLTVTDEEGTSAADDYLKRYMTQVQDMLRQAIGTKLDLSKPEIKFGDDEVFLSVKGGKGLLKVNASLQASVIWNGSSLDVNVKSIDIPIVSVDPATVNAYIQKPINDSMAMLQQYYEIHSFKIVEGSAIIEATKK